MRSSSPFVSSSRPAPAGREICGAARARAFEQCLSGQIGLGSAAATVAGEMIAVGIFLAPAGMIKSIGSPLWLLIVWSGMGIMALCGALCYGYLAGRFPHAGGGYVYLREAYGNRLAFLYGWMCFLVMDPGIAAALAVGMAGYVGYVTPLAFVAEKAVAIGAILALAAMNVVGIRLGAGIMRWLTMAKLGSLAFIAIWGLGLRLGNWGNFFPLVDRHPGLEPLPAALAGGMLAAFFSFGGWWDVSKIAGEVRDPARTLPRALTLGVSAVTAAYILITAVFLYLVPAGNVTSDETFAAQAGEVLFGRAGGRVFSGIVIVSVLGSLAGLIMTAPRVYYAMSRDRLFPALISRAHRRFGTPARAIALQAAMASVLVLAGGFAQIVAYFLFISVLFIALTVGSVFGRNCRLQTRHRVSGYPVTPLIFLSFVTVLLILLAGTNPRQSLLGVLVVALGAPVYHFCFEKKPEA